MKRNVFGGNESDKERKIQSKIAFGKPRRYGHNSLSAMTGTERSEGKGASEA
jgi:hypothetical protein